MGNLHHSILKNNNKLTVLVLDGCNSVGAEVRLHLSNLNIGLKGVRTVNFASRFIMIIESVNLRF
jgi:hypothetical protein